jgi:hypothetical protein
MLDTAKNVLTLVKPVILKFSVTIGRWCKSLQHQLKLLCAGSRVAHVVLWSL